MMAAISDFAKEAERHLYWKDDVAYLPGSSLSFKRGPDGELLLESFDENLMQKRQKLIKDCIFGENILLCRYCLTATPKKEMCKNERFCSKCSSINQINLKVSKSLSQNEDLIMKKKDNEEKKDDKETKEDQEMKDDQETKEDEEVDEDDDISEVKDVSDFDFTELVINSKKIYVPHSAFTPEQRCCSRNRFQIGQRLEGIDPTNPSKFHVLSVAEIIGHRIRLHFDGYDDEYDFFTTNSNSLIFPAGFCKSTKRKLEPPPKVKNFNWNEYLKETNSEAAPAEAFWYTAHSRERDGYAKTYGFKVGLKLEAADRATEGEICVATIKDIINHQLLISFDGWDESYDYWVAFYSTLIHPINWCQRNKVALMPPKNYSENNREFVWAKYLRETNSKAVPSVAFRRSQSRWPRDNFQTKLKLEAVDCRNPRVTRIATIEELCSQTIVISYDGWDSKYNTKIHKDALELFPALLSMHYDHPFQCPPYFLDEATLKAGTKCPTKNCSGDGHIQWYKYTQHDDVKDCPYSDENYQKFSDPRVDKFINETYEELEDNESNQSDDVILLSSDSSRATSPSSPDRSQDMIYGNSQNDNKALSIDDSNDSGRAKHYLSSMRKHFKSNYKRLKGKINSFEEAMIRETEDFVEKLDIDLVDFVHKDCTKIESLITKFTNDAKFANNFRQQNIDGMALLLLAEEEIKHLNNLDFSNSPLAPKTECLIYFLIKPLYED